MGKRFTLGLAALALAGPAFGQVPATKPAPQPAYLTHPLGVKPDHGAYMICVKSYTGPQSQKLAETLAEHVRTVHQAAAYLFEYGGEQRAQEEARQARAREMQYKEKVVPFLQAQEEARKQAQAEGRRFIEEPVKVTVPKVTVPEQWAVLVGGFPSEEAARKALDVVRTWPAPAERLMDQQFSVGGDNAGGTYINPFATAMVLPSPARKRGASGPPPMDPALVKMNADEPLSLLKSKKPYTLLVKAFSVKFVAKGKDEEPGMLDRLLGKGDESAKMLQATAHDARQMAEALRQPNFQQTAQKDAREKMRFTLKPFEVFVLHTRTGSLVCVGEFDGEDDPDLTATGRALQEMGFEVSQTQGGPGKRQRLFDNVIPLRVPRP